MSPVEAVEIESRTDATRRETWALLAAGGVLIGGVFADGWAHDQFVDDLESFITPWHTIIFAGYLGALVVMVLAVRRRLDGFRTVLDAIPRGWTVAAIGVAVFGAGFVGDGIWHTVFGIEADLEALLSPTHLLMLSGGVSIFAGPITAVWSDPQVSRTPAPAVFRPVIVAMVLIASSVAFFFLWLWHIRFTFQTDGFVEWARFQDGFVSDAGVVWGVTTYIVTGLWMTVPALVLLRRWDLPPGAFAALVLVPSGLLLAVQEFRGAGRIGAVVGGALFAEWLIARLRPGPARPWAARSLTLGFVSATFALDWLVLAAGWTVAWPAEFVAGSVVFSALVALAVSFAVFPAAVPPTAER